MRRITTTTEQYSIGVVLVLMAMLAVAALTILGVFAAPASAQEEEGKSVLCHRTGSEENPFLAVEVDGSSIPGAHTGHGDFILGPASEFEGIAEDELEKACAEADPTTTGTTTGATTGDGSAAEDQYNDGGAADDQYDDGGDVNNPKDVIPDTTSKKPLPNTGGVSLLGLAVGALALVGVSFSVLRTSIRRDL
jgi:hypothetical protein